MFNKSLFKGKVMARGMTLASLAEAIGINASTMTRKLKQGTFDRAEINAISDVLQLTDEEIIEIFFAH